MTHTMVEMTVSRAPAGLGLDQSADPFGRLVAGDWLLPTGVPGLLSYTPKFEAVLARLQAALTMADPSGSPGPAWHAPVVPRGDIERAQYAESFPHLLGTVHALASEHTAGVEVPGEADRRPTDVVLAPAVCYNIYPRLADSVLTESAGFDAAGYCYRHEATSELGRFRSFRMREFVLVGGADEASRWRDDWITRTSALFADFGLTVSVDPASDPFFGPGGRFMRSSQVQQSLKFEFVVPVHGADPGTAIASANCHKEHLGERFAITYADQGFAHSSCMAFGLERTMLALVHAHGDRLADWPDALV